MNKTILLRHVSRRFGATMALRDVSLSFPTKGLVAIVGHSGSGKSTLLNILAGIDVGFEGQAHVLGVALRKANEAKRRRLRIQKIGYVFQNFNLLELETAEMNVLSVIDACFQGTREERRRKARDLLTLFGMEKKAGQKANTLSGGEKQRVALARALACDPKIVLADEPTGSLDQRNAEEVFSLLRRCSKDRLVVVVSHDETLCRKHADAIVTMADGAVRSVEQLRQSPRPSSPRSFFIKQRKAKPRFSWTFLLKHAFHSMKAKKWRTLLSNAVIAMGLTGMGLSAYISSSISDELNAAFSAIVPPSTVVMSPRGGGESPLGAIYGATFEDCEYAVEEYGDMALDYGSDIHLDYESWFVDANEFFFKSGPQAMRLKDFSARSVNDFQWLDLHPDLHCYPRRPALLSMDQVVLGLPYQNMFTTCLDLRIVRSYQSLGDHIDAHGMTLYLSVANEEYGFDDEEAFQVVAVVESEVPCLYHLDHRWNHRVIIDQMQFRSSLTEANPTPQYVLEIPYLQLEVPASEFLFKARRDPRLEHLVFETASHEYAPTICPIGKRCDLGRLYIYGADKTGVSYETMDFCADLCPEIIGRQPATEGSYYASPDSLAMGFSGKFYLCSSRDVADEVADAYSDLPFAAAFLPGDPIEGALDGSTFASGSGGVRVASAPKGAKPLVAGVEECLLSESIYQAWGEPKEVFVAAEISGEQVGSAYVREIAIASMKVLGSVADEHPSFYVQDDWTVDFFLECLGMSSFSLEPYGTVFHLEAGADGGGVIEKLEKALPDYAFFNPSEEIASSIVSVLGYVGKILMAFSVLSLGMSALLFLIVMTITMNECVKEASMFCYLGASKNDVVRSFLAYAFLYSVFATFCASGTVAMAEIAVKIYVSRAFSGTASALFAWQPIGVVFASSTAFTLLIMLGISLNLRIKMMRNPMISR